MKNLYRELKNRQQKEMNAFPLGACFCKEQFADMMQKWDLTENDTDKIYSIGYGCYIRKSDHAAFHEMLDRHERERKEAIAADKTGDGYIYQMFLAELADHEYCITYDYEDTVFFYRNTYTKSPNNECGKIFSIHHIICQNVHIVRIQHVYIYKSLFGKTAQIIKRQINAAVIQFPVLFIKTHSSEQQFRKIIIHP